jgi:hypothetical protein
MTPDLVGRASEITVVESLLAGIADGGGSLLVLGDPGIGKSAVVEAAAQRAVDAGIRVLACAGVPSEAQYSFAGLHQAAGLGGRGCGWSSRRGCLRPWR